MGASKDVPMASTQEALYRELTDLGEHYSSGMPLAYPDGRTLVLLEKVMREIERGLGKPNPIEVMRHELERHARRDNPDHSHDSALPQV